MTTQYFTATAVLIALTLVSCGSNHEKTSNALLTESSLLAPADEMFTLLDGTRVSLNRELSTLLTKQGPYSQEVLEDDSDASLESVMQIVPNHARSLFGSAPEGPNCFNFVRHYLDPKHPLQTDAPFEFAEFLQNSMTALKPGQTIQPGDVITLWQTFLPVQGALMLVNSSPSSIYSHLRHAGVYLGNGWIAEKPGIASVDGPYRVVSSIKSFDHYWNKPSFPTGFIGSERELQYYEGKKLPPTIVVFRFNN
jgi:hypothetical protein